VFKVGKTDFGKGMVMKTKAILMAALVLMTVAGLAQAQDDIGGTLDLTYQSAYMFRGYDMYAGKHGEGAIQPSIDLDLGGGFGFLTLMSRANTSDYENKEWFNYRLYYGDSMMMDQPCQTDWEVGFNYFNFPDLPDKAADMHEFYGKFSWPNMFENGVVPYYGVYRSWPDEGGSTFGQDAGGWMHQLGMSYDMTMEGMTADMPEMVVTMMAEVWHNGSAWGHLNTQLATGTTDVATDVDHDWSHFVLGATTEMPVGEWVMSPGIFYQHTMEDDVTDQPDIVWGKVSMAYKF
jgi:hypothetical protein